jgi:hypothetical protein
VVLAFLIGGCTSEPADVGTTLRTSAIWTAVDDELPLLESDEESSRRQTERGCVRLTEIHELEGPDERVLTAMEEVATDEGWDVLYRESILEVIRSVEDLDGPSPQMVVERPMGEITLHVAFTVSQHPDFDGRWTLGTVGDCRDTNPDVD